MAPIRKAGTVARRLSIAAGASAGALALALWNDGWWGSLAVLAAGPAIVLWMFSEALLAVAALPERVRDAPAEAGQLAAAWDEVRRARGAAIAFALWRAARRAAGARDLATPWAPLVALASIPFLVATAVSALAVPLIVLAALIALALAV